MSATRIRIVVAKPGLDGHDRGAKIIARALMTLVPRIVQLLYAEGAGDVVVTVGGTIPQRDIAQLKALGVAEVFTPRCADRADHRLPPWRRGASRHPGPRRPRRSAAARRPGCGPVRHVPLHACHATGFSAADSPRGEHAVDAAARMDGPSRAGIDPLHAFAHVEALERGRRRVSERIPRSSRARSRAACPRRRRAPRPVASHAPGRSRARRIRPGARRTSARCGRRRRRPHGLPFASAMSPNRRHRAKLLTRWPPPGR